MLEDFQGGRRNNTVDPSNNQNQIITPEFKELEPYMGKPSDYNPASDSPSPATPTAETTDTPAEKLPKPFTNPTVSQSSLDAEKSSTKPAAKKSLPAWRPNRKTTIIAVSFTALLLVGAVAAYFVFQKNDKPEPAPAKQPVVVAPEPKPEPITSNLTGAVITDASINQRPVTGVMIENSTAARPQSGLDQAGVVFEAIAEGGITRFLALFQDTTPDLIGPMRSARPYYVQWCMGYDCALAHVGGSPEALQNIRDWGTKDLDQPGQYWRQSGRYSPHNAYSSIAKLNQIEVSKGYGAATFTPLPRKADKPQTPTASSINVNISSALYNSHYAYDPSNNSYKRSQSGAPHMVVNQDGAETQITPKNLVILATNYSRNGIYSVYGTIGSGEALVFQDGIVTKATWSKPDIKAMLTLTDATGKPLLLNAGQTWFAVVSHIDKVGYN